MSTELSLLPPAGEWDTMMKMATTLQRSGLLPESINTPEKAVTIMLKGRELGIPPMQAFASIHVIKGKPSLSSDLMSSLVRSGGHSIKIIESTDKRCEVQGKRKDTGDAYTSVFTHEMAVKAQLPSQNPNYGKYPENMLRARAISNLCRTLFSDIIMGMYTPEEVEDFAPTQEAVTTTAQEVTDTTTGEIVTPPRLEAPKPKQHRKLSEDEQERRSATNLNLINNSIVSQATVDTEGYFLPITMSDFNIALKKLTSQPDATSAGRKYGLEGSWADSVKERYNGEGLKMAQQFSAVLHIMWEKEQEYQADQESDNVDDEWDALTSASTTAGV